LQALGSDFYPRLTAVANDFAACNRMVNQQIRIGSLLAVPGVLATLLLAPWVIDLFYSQDFRASVELLRWLCPALSLRVVSWPMMFILLARGSRIRYFWSEAVFTALCLGLTWPGLMHYGLNGVGMALLVAQGSHALLMYGIVHRLCDFRLTPENRQLAVLGAGIIGLVFAGFHLLDEDLARVTGFAGLMVSLFFVGHHLLDLIPPRLIPYPLLWLLTRQPCFVVYERRAWRFAMLTGLGLWGFWYEEAYGWKSGLNHFVGLSGITP
jgi:PST family polysaccharide transporter